VLASRVSQRNLGVPQNILCVALLSGQDRDTHLHVELQIVRQAFGGFFDQAFDLLRSQVHMTSIPKPAEQQHELSVAQLDSCCPPPGKLAETYAEVIQSQTGGNVTGTRARVVDVFNTHQYDCQLLCLVQSGFDAGNDPARIV
jgi:hypothetical protein